MTTRTDFIAKILDAPWEYTPYLALADWLDERGEDEAFAFALRWMAAKGHRPHHREFYPGRAPGTRGRRVPEKFAWGWYCESITPREILSRDGVQGYARLPRIVYLSFVGWSPSHFSRSWSAAVDSLAFGLEHIRKAVAL